MERITQLQLIFLLTLFVHCDAIAFMIGPLTAESSYSAWAAVLVGGIVSFLLVYVTLRLCRKWPDPLSSAGTSRFGKWVLWAVWALTLFFLLHTGSMILRKFDDFLSQTYLPTTPDLALAVLMMFCVVVGARLGIETIARCASGFFFIIYGALILIPFMVAKDLNWEIGPALFTNLKFSEAFSGGMQFAPWFGELICVIVLLPVLADPPKTARSVGWGLAIGLATFLMHWVLTTLIFGVHLMPHLTYPVLETIRYFRLGDFIENADPFLVAVWMTALFMKQCTLFYCCCILTAKLLKLQDYRPISLSLGAVFVTMSHNLDRNASQLDHFLVHEWPIFAWTFECLPLVYVIFRSLRSKGAGQG